MAHLIIIRQAQSHSCCKNSSLGAHESLEKAIAYRKYPVQAKRSGYNTPFSSTIHFLDYRVKKEIIGDFVKDLRCVNLNPSPNDITLWQVISKPDKLHKEATVGRLFKIIQWLFKWINRKVPTIIILSLLSVLTTSFLPLLFALLVLINPLKPVPVSKKHSKKFIDQWHYDFCFGYLEDCYEKGGLHNELQQNDIL